MEKIDQEGLIKELINAFEPIESEVIRMMGNRLIFQEVVEISEKNKEISKSNSFWDFLKESYIALMVSAVCRQIDMDSRSSSLINLLNKILNPSIIENLTKDWYSKQYHRDDDVLPSFMVGIGQKDFEKHFGSKEYVNPDIVHADLERLIGKTKEIKRFRNKRIAHRDRRNNLIFDVNFNDLNEAIETIRMITSKYYLLFKQGSNSLIPINQTDWQEIFTVPWIRKE